MKFLYFTDTHIRANSPSKRKDNYVESLLEKFQEIKNIGSDNDVDFYVHGGDLLDRPDVPIQTIRRFVKIMQSFKRPIFFVPGNHDIYAYNVESLNRTALPLLDDFGLLSIMSDTSPILFSIDDVSVALYSASYNGDLDTDIGREKYIVKEKLADFDILFAHGMLLTKPFKNISYTLIDDIKHTKADLTLCGHYHTGFANQKVDEKYFYNPGSVARVSATEIELKRKPKVSIVTLEKNKDIEIEDFYLKSAKPGEEVLDREAILRDKEENQRLELQKYEIEKIDFDKIMDIRDLLNKIDITESLDEEVRNKAIELVTEAQNEQIE